MKNILENKLGMYQKVQGYLSLHAAETAPIAMVATLKTQLDTAVSTLQTIAITADADMSGHTADKQNSRALLKNACLKVSTAVVAYASINSINKLLEKCDETPSSMDYMRDNDFYTYCRTVSTEATPIVASLAPFACLPADITALDSASQNFLVLIQDPRLQINERSNAINDLELQFDAIDSLLKNKLDKVMMVFIPTDPSLYNGYKGARAIDDDGGSSTPPDFDLSVEAGNTLLIANMPYLESRTFLFKNLGDEELIFALSPDESIQGTPASVAANSQAQRNSPNLNTDQSANMLLVQNNGSNPLNFQVWVSE